VDKKSLSGRRPRVCWSNGAREENIVQTHEQNPEFHLESVAAIFMETIGIQNKFISPLGSFGRTRAQNVGLGRTRAKT
jgi:hypothetical protein